MPSFAEPVRPTVQMKSEGATPALIRRPVAEAAPPAAPAPLPVPLRSGAEALGGFSLADVKVHRNSPEPAKLGALAFARGSDIHLGPGQERHLPHEAWHVVQQKQGRVNTGWQRGETAMNDDPSLEREASNFSASGLLSAQAGSAPLRQSATVQPVVQRMIIQNGAELPPGEYSKTAAGYHSLPGKFILKDTDDPKDERLHLLQSPKRYLIGEFHDIQADQDGTSRWATTIENWQFVTKVREGEETTTSHGTSQLKAAVSSLSHNRLEKARGPKDNAPYAALESVHEYIFASVAALSELMKELEPDRFHRNRRWRKYFLKDTMRSISEHLNTLTSGWHLDYIMAFEGLTALGELQPTPELIKVYKFHLDFRDDYLPNLLVMKANLLFLYLSVSKEHLDAKSEFSTFKNDISKPEKYLDVVVQRASVLTFMLEEFAGIAGITPEEYRALTEILFPSETKKAHAGKADAEVALTATSGPRERAMITNLAAIPEDKCPVLVQIGDAHVEPVRKALGAAAAAVPFGVDLDKVTLVTKPPKADRERPEKVGR